jgi:hypothetical protein
MQAMRMATASILLALAPLVFAQVPTPFVGGAVYGVVSPDAGVGVLLGVAAQVGAHNVAGPFGLRATGEYNLRPTVYIQIDSDALFSFPAEDVIPYFGAGGGIRLFPGATGLGYNVHGVAGIEILPAPDVGLFVEGLPTLLLDPGTQLFTLKGRAGLNIHF